MIMTEDEEMYRLMNEEDPWYMGPKSEVSDRDERREYKRTSDKKKKSK